MLADSKQSSPVVYRDVPGFPGYRVGSDGSVWTCWENLRRKGSRVGDTWRPLKTFTRKAGYVQFKVVRDKKKYRLDLHRVMCEAFHGPCPPGMEAAHGNGIKADCRADNLSWKTRKANQADKKRHGTNNGGVHYGEKNGSVKLTDAQAGELRRRKAAGEKTGELAADFKIHRYTVWAICSGKSRGNGSVTKVRKSTCVAVSDSP